MKIYIPEEIAHYEPQLRYFFDCMVQKLNTNRHKGFAEGHSLTEFMDLADSELDEAARALHTDDQFAFFMEMVDVANMSWLASIKALRMTKDEWQDGQSSKGEADEA